MACATFIRRRGRVRDDRVSYLDLKNNKLAIAAGFGYVDAAAAGRAVSDGGVSVRDDAAGRLAEVVFHSGQE